MEEKPCPARTAERTSGNLLAAEGVVNWASAAGNFLELSTARE
jgi:hypothetical protein